MKGCSWREEGENCAWWGHVGKYLTCSGLSESATAGRYAEYHKAVGMDVEVLGLTVHSVGVEASDVALIYIHVETMLCKYRSDRWCNVEHQGRRAHYLSVILVGDHVARPGKGLRRVGSVVGRCRVSNVSGQVKEGSLITEFEKETAPGVTLAHSSPGVGYDVTGVVSHLGRGAVLPAKETSDGAVPVKDGGEDGAVAYCIKRVGDVDSNDGVFLAVR